MLFVDYVTQTYVLWPWFHGSPVGVLHAVLFQTSVLLILWAYVSASTTDPGTVKRGTASKADIYPPADDAERAFKPKRRYCDKCACIKPPRAHHCSTCQRCVHKMDRARVATRASHATREGRDRAPLCPPSLSQTTARGSTTAWALAT